MVTKIRIIPSSHPRYAHEVVVPKRAFGRRIRKRFTSRSAAESYKRTLLAELDTKTLAPLDRDIHLIASRYQADFTPDQFESALADALASRVQANPPLGELIQAYVDAQDKALKRGAIAYDTARDARVRGKALIRDLGTLPVRDLGTPELEEYIENSLEIWAPRNVVNHLRCLSAVMNRAVRAGTIEVNPVPLVSPPSYSTPVTILTPSELSTLCAAADPLTLNWLMFGAFAGLRTSETARLQWEDIRLGEGELYVRQGKTKNAERWVKIQRPLDQYLATLPAQSGLVLPASKNTKLRAKRATMKRAGVDIPRNALRHSYGSHHLVEFGEPSKTATEMGHHSPQVTYSAYRKAVTRAQAAEYWRLTPLLEQR